MMTKYTIGTFAFVLIIATGIVGAQTGDDSPALPDGVHSLVGKFSTVYKSGKQAFKPVNDAFLHQVVVPAAEGQQVLQKKFNKTTMAAGKAVGQVATGALKTTVKTGGGVVKTVTGKKD